MKKTIALLVLILILSNTHAQVKKIPTTISAPTWDITSRSTGHRGYKDADIRLFFTTHESLGRTLNFTSNKDISKVEISFPDSNFPKSTSLYNDNTKTGFWHLETAAYNKGLKSGYMLYFFVKNFDKPVWVAIVKPSFK